MCQFSLFRYFNNSFGQKPFSWCDLVRGDCLHGGTVSSTSASMWWFLERVSGVHHRYSALVGMDKRGKNYNIQLPIWVKFWYESVCFLKSRRSLIKSLPHVREARFGNTPIATEAVSRVLYFTAERWCSAIIHPCCAGKSSTLWKGSRRS